MTQEAPHEGSSLVLTDLHDNDAIAVMPEFASVETNITGEKSRIVQSSKNDDNVVIQETFSAPIYTNLPYRYAPCFKQLALSFEDILVQKNQTRRDSILASVTTYWPE
jgi:hypothetical protein